METRGIGNHEAFPLGLGVSPQLDEMLQQLHSCAQRHTQPIRKMAAAFPARQGDDSAIEASGQSDAYVVVSINFSSTLRVPALTGNFGTRLDCFAMRAAILAILRCQTTATRVSTAVLVFIFHRQSLLTSSFPIVLHRVGSPLAVHWESQ